jgi:hypothetical protein
MADFEQEFWEAFLDGREGPEVGRFAGLAGAHNIFNDVLDWSTTEIIERLVAQGISYKISDEFSFYSISVVEGGHLHQFIVNKTLDEMKFDLMFNLFPNLEE